MLSVSRRSWSNTGCEGKSSSPPTMSSLGFSDPPITQNKGVEDDREHGRRNRSKRFDPSGVTGPVDTGFGPGNAKGP